MKLLIQRVSEASVTVEGACTGAIDAGFMVLVGCRHDDTVADVEYLAGKLTTLRIFNDEAGRMNRSLIDTGGSVLLISQFTLYADTRKGNRPGFTLAGAPEHAESLFNFFIQTMQQKLGSNRVATGVFGAEMRVALINEGPVTIELTSDSQSWHSADTSLSKRN